MRRDAGEINAEIWRLVDELIETGHPGAAAVGFDRNAIRQWFEQKHPKGIELLSKYKEAIRRQGWSGDEPTPVIEPREARDIGEALRFGGDGQTRASAAIRALARKRCGETGQNPRDPKAFHAAYTEICNEDRIHSAQRGEPSLVELHRKELRER